MDDCFNRCLGMISRLQPIKPSLQGQQAIV